MYSRDFTLNALRELLIQLKRQYHFQTFSDFLENSGEKTVIFRHDVDLRPHNALKTAQLEASLGIVGVYNFRTIPQTFHESIIKQIFDLGHEIGYHYEDMDLVKADNLDQHIDLAYKSFRKNLESLRQIVPVKTICMHGSPRAKYDNKMIWTKYNYRNLDLIGEPYFDIDFNNFLYLTDTGRKWNGDKVSVRDKVNSKFKFDLRSTKDVIHAIPKFPNRLMVTIHPQRWDEKIIPWTKEIISQNVKNIIKWGLVKRQINH